MLICRMAMLLNGFASGFPDVAAVCNRALRAALAWTVIAKVAVLPAGRVARAHVPGWRHRHRHLLRRLAGDPRLCFCTRGTVAANVTRRPYEPGVCLASGKRRTSGT
jgi:hypothetical protein